MKNRLVAESRPGELTDRSADGETSDKQIIAAAQSDVDAQPLSPSALREFRRIEPVDIRALRQRLGLSQAGFAGRFGVNLRTIQDWEQGRRQPQGPARVLLYLIDRNPGMVDQFLGDDR